MWDRSSVREPKWSSGAYAGAPRVAPSGTLFESHAHIECWRGTPAEFVSVLKALVRENEAADVVVEVEWKDHTRSRVKGLAAIEAQLSTVPQTRRIVAQLANEGPLKRSCVRAQSTIPGLAIHAIGTDRDTVWAVTQQAFSRAMIGYIDRFGTWRAPLWAILTIGLPGAAMLLLPEPDDARLQIAIVVALLGWLAVSLFMIWPRFLADRPFVLVAAVERRRTVDIARDLLRRSKRRVRTWVLGTVAGLILSGLLVNGLYDGAKASLETLLDLVRR